MIDEADKPKLRHLLENLEESSECFERLNAHVQRLTEDMPNVRITGDLRKHTTRGTRERIRMITTTGMAMATGNHAGLFTSFAKKPGLA